MGAIVGSAPYFAVIEDTWLGRGEGERRTLPFSWCGWWASERCELPRMPLLMLDVRISKERILKSCELMGQWWGLALIEFWGFLPQSWYAADWRFGMRGIQYRIWFGARKSGWDQISCTRYGDEMRLANCMQMRNTKKNINWSYGFQQHLISHYRYIPRTSW